MYRVLLVGLLFVSLGAVACNKANEQKDEAALGAAGGSAQASADQSAPLMAASDSGETPRAVEIPPPTEASDDYVRAVLQIAPEYGINYEEEKNILVREQGNPLGTPEDIASRAEMLVKSGSEPSIKDPMEAVRFILESLTRQEDASAQVQTPPPPPPQEENQPEAKEPDLDAMNTEQMLITLAPEYDLSYNSNDKTLHGAGFPATGIQIGTAVSKVSVNLEQRGSDSAEAREAESRTVLKQLSELGKQRAQQQQQQEQQSSTEASGGTGAAGKAASGHGRNPLEYHPDSSEFIYPQSVYGDWKSIREDHPDKTEVAHSDDYYSEVQLRYQGNAVFRLHRNGELFSNTEFPYKYDPRSGKLSLMGPDGKEIQSYTVWATEKDPLLIWLQREGSRIKTLYQKVGRGGEPVTEEELIAGIRELLGEEGVKNYLKYKEQQRHEQSSE